ncbi:hypothetical protein [Actinoplanes sp. NPDC051851]|uniref:protein kinase domain-containing protein n=1 Tax=Actinoplanes sp. NPDC051851 TaxID=3154753 RepID=UPI00341AFB6F
MTTGDELICGLRPEEPLYYLDQQFGTSGQARVYRGHGPGPDGGPVTVRVWKPADGRDHDVQKRSWRNGAAVLRSLAGVPGVCRARTDFDGYVWRAGADAASSGPALSGPALSGPALSGPALSGPALSGSALSGPSPSAEPVPIQILEWIEGESLHDRLRPGSRLAARDGDLPGAEVLRALADTLRELSRRGPIIHQDIEPNNLIIADDGRVVLIDFTSARSEGGLTHFVGKRDYASPEVLATLAEREGVEWDTPPAIPSVASDVFGFGSVALYLLFRTPPRTGYVPNLDRIRMPPGLRSHLLDGVLAAAAERPRVGALHTWIDNLVKIIQVTGLETPGVRWPRLVPPAPRRPESPGSPGPLGSPGPPGSPGSPGSRWAEPISRSDRLADPVGRGDRWSESGAWESSLGGLSGEDRSSGSRFRGDRAGEPAAPVLERRVPGAGLAGGVSPEAGVTDAGLTDAGPVETGSSNPSLGFPEVLDLRDVPGLLAPAPISPIDMPATVRAEDWPGLRPAVDPWDPEGLPSTEELDPGDLGPGDLELGELRRAEAGSGMVSGSEPVPAGGGFRSVSALREAAEARPVPAPAQLRPPGCRTVLTLPHQRAAPARDQPIEPGVARVANASSPLAPRPEPTRIDGFPGATGGAGVVGQAFTGAPGLAFAGAVRPAVPPGETGTKRPPTELLPAGDEFLGGSEPDTDALRAGAGYAGSPHTGSLQASLHAGPPYGEGGRAGAGVAGGSDGWGSGGAAGGMSGGVAGRGESGMSGGVAGRGEAADGWEGLRHYLLGIEYALVPGAAAGASWLVWLVSNGLVGNAESYGSLILVMVAAAAAELIVYPAGARLLGMSERWGGTVWSWRVLHIPAGVIFLLAVAAYAFVF